MGGQPPHFAKRFTERFAKTRPKPLTEGETMNAHELTPRQSAEVEGWTALSAWSTETRSHRVRLTAEKAHSEATEMLGRELTFTARQDLLRARNGLESAILSIDAALGGK